MKQITLVLLFFITNLTHAQNNSFSIVETKNNQAQQEINFEIANAELLKNQEKIESGMRDLNQYILSYKIKYNELKDLQEKLTLQENSLLSLKENLIQQEFFLFSTREKLETLQESLMIKSHLFNIQEKESKEQKLEIAKLKTLLDISNHNSIIQQNEKKLLLDKSIHSLQKK